MSLLNIAAGVVLILLGMRHLRKGLDRLFGNKLIDWLQETTANRGKSFLAGIVAGTAFLFRGAKYRATLVANAESTG